MAAGPDITEDIAAIADRLGRWAAEFTLDQASDAVANQARRCIVDVIGVTLAGAGHPTAVLTRRQVRDLYGQGPCFVAGDPTRTSPAGAALANGVAAHALDFDDVSYEAMVHGTAAVWPAVQAAAEASGATGEQALAAFIAGVEAEYAVARMLTPELFWDGWWTTGLLGSIGAAVGAAKAMRLDAETIGEAAGIAACQATGPYALVGSPVKPYAMGRAAEAGIQAAHFAAAGLTGPEDAFEHEKGFIAMFAGGRFEPRELDRLGRRYLLETPGVAMKRFPVCAGAQSAVEAMLEVAREAKLDADDVSHIRCEVTPDVGYYMPFSRPETVTQAQFSLPFCLACALANGDLTVSHLSMDTLGDPRLARQMAKVETVLSEELAARSAGDAQYDQPAILTVTTADGREIRKAVPAPTGVPVRPMSDSQLDDKFHGCTADVIGAAGAAGLLDRIRHIETLPAAADLFSGPGPKG